jgi:hypothetical protein
MTTSASLASALFRPLIGSLTSSASASKASSAKNGFIGLGLTGFIGLGLGSIVNSLQFEIDMKPSPHDLFWRESGLWCVRRVFSSLVGLNSVFGNALQNATQLFFDRILQMTKDCVMRECENILHGFLYVFDLAFVILKGIYIINSPKGFWRSLPEISLLLHFFSSSAKLKT